MPDNPVRRLCYLVTGLPTGMLQALRKIRKPECGRNWTTVLPLLVLACALAIPGCASLGLTAPFMSDSILQEQEQSTIRSQSSTDSDGLSPGSEPIAEADDSVSRTAADSSSPVAANVNTAGIVPIYASGHSFVQRRARLGKPVMLPVKPETASPTVDPTSPETSVNGIHAPAHEAISDAEIGAASSVLGITPGESGWQKIPVENVTQPTPDGGPKDSSNTSWPRNGSQQALPVSPADPPVPASDQRGNAVEGNPGFGDSAADSGEAPRSDDMPDESSGADGSEVSPREPGMLERLRGLYIPRREEPAAERNRKSARRWTDPFGLLRERDPETADTAVGASSPLPGPAESEIVDAETQESQVAAPDSEDLLNPLIEKLEKELSEWRLLTNGKPADEAEWRRRQTDLRMLYLIAGRAAESVRVIEALPEKEQEFWQAMMLAMDAYRRPDDAAGRTGQLTETLDYVRTASRQLQPLSALRIRRLNFCNRIDGFGMLSVYPASEFNAGQPLLLYAEIENYMSELSPDGQYRSEFTAMIEFFRDGDTEPIASRTIRLPEIEDLCATERTDYFQSYELTVPALSPGKYRLRLRVRDQLSQQTATTELPFDIRPLGSQRID